MIEQRQDPRSAGELFADLTSNLSRLVRSEAQLAKTELTRKAGEVRRAMVFLAAGVGVVYGGFLALLAAAAAGLWAAGLPLWVSALIVGAAAIGAGATLVQQGLSLLSAGNLAPNETLQVLRTEGQWAKGRES